MWNSWDSSGWKQNEPTRHRAGLTVRKATSFGPQRSWRWSSKVPIDVFKRPTPPQRAGAARQRTGCSDLVAREEQMAGFRAQLSPTEQTTRQRIVTGVATVTSLLTFTNRISSGPARSEGAVARLP